MYPDVFDKSSAAPCCRTEELQLTKTHKKLGQLTLIRPAGDRDGHVVNTQALQVKQMYTTHKRCPSLKTIYWVNLSIEVAQSGTLDKIIPL